jgi:hypothetical protein
MADSLIQTIEKNLGITPITKVDPNTQDVKSGVSQNETHSIDQAAIPASLAGLYKFSRTQGGAQAILSGSSDSWVSTFFDQSTDDVVSHAAEFAGTSKDEAYQKMEVVAKEAVNVVRNNAKDGESLHSYLQSQRREILTYLPAELHVGDMLGDNTLDDRTNKMEGPVSSFMQKLANLFDSTDKAPESKTHF